jgi:hypothetical protein
MQFFPIPRDRQDIDFSSVRNAYGGLHKISFRLEPIFYDFFCGVHGNVLMFNNTGMKPQSHTPARSFDPMPLSNLILRDKNVLCAYKKSFEVLMKNRENANLGG